MMTGHRASGFLDSSGGGEDRWFLNDDKVMLQSLGSRPGDRPNPSDHFYRGRVGVGYGSSVRFMLGDRELPGSIGDPVGPFGADFRMRVLGTRVDFLADLQNRLEEVNRHFRRKIAAVVNDDAAVRLLASMYQDVVVETSDFNFSRDGRSLAKLTAAHFCEVGANGVYITDQGRRFVASLGIES